LANIGNRVSKLNSYYRKQVNFTLKGDKYFISKW